MGMGKGIKGALSRSRRCMSWLLLSAIVVFASAIPIRAQAQAGCTSGACVSAGPRLVSVDTTQSLLLNPLLQSLLPGTSVNLTAVDWNSIAGADIKLNALITRLGTNLSLSDPSQVLAANITIAQLQAAMVQVLQADGNTAAANALNLLTPTIGGLAGTIRLGDLLQIALPQGSLANINLDVLDLLTGSAQLYNFKNVLTTPTPIAINTAALGLTGLANLQLWLQVVEPPVYVCGPAGTQFHSSAVRVKLNLDVVQGFDTSQIIAAINALGLGLTNVSLTADVLKLQVYADVTRAQGTIATVNAIGNAVTLNAQPGLAGLYIGSVPDSLFFNRTHVVSSSDFTPLLINNLDLKFQVNLAGLLSVHVPLRVYALAAATGAPPMQSFTVNGPFPKTITANAGTVSAGTLVTDLLNNLSITVQPDPIEVTLLGVPIAVPAALLPIVNSIVGAVQTALQTAVVPLLTPVLNTLLGGVVDNLLGLLGIHIGQAVFTVEGIAQSCAAVLALTKELLPAGNPGLFNLTISQGATVVASAANVGNGGTTGTYVTTPGTVYALAESAGTSTTLAPYATTWSCTDQNNTVVSSGSGTSFNYTSPAAGSSPLTITCRITNRALQANLQISKSDGSSTYTPGNTAVYVITVSNSGPDPVTGAAVNDALPNGMSLSGPWTCSATGGTCGAASGGAAGGKTVSLTVDLSAGGQATISVPVTFSANPAAY
ncbi:hypothetical protein [Solilutibacter silvestris]|uniref:hypothetical protein n=1 Tax=Solilutibacter silvestris TaxID=1645665 RepID=UPI003D32D04B